MGAKKKTEIDDDITVNLDGIVQGNWTPTQKRFIFFLAYPPIPDKTQAEFAKDIGLKRRGTLSDWKALPGFMDDVERVATAVFRELGFKIDGVLARKARDGELPAIALWYKRWNMLREQLDLNVTKSETVFRWETEEEKAERISRCPKCGGEIPPPVDDDDDEK